MMRAALARANFVKNRNTHIPPSFMV